MVGTQNERTYFTLGNLLSAHKITQIEVRPPFLFPTYFRKADVVVVHGALNNSGTLRNGLFLESNCFKDQTVLPSVSSFCFITIALQIRRYAPLYAR